MSANGADLLQLGLKHVGEKYHLGAAVPKDNAKWTGPWDCAEFASWIVFQVAGVLFGCSNDSGNPATADAYTGFWDRDAGVRGHIIPIDEAGRTPGAAVLRRPGPSGIGHIVLSDGMGGTVEAHSSADGVIQSKLAGRRWDMGILIPEINYQPLNPVTVPPPPSKIYRLAIPPMHGPMVQQIQTNLKQKGFDPGVIDGNFGPHTQAAVTALQLSLGLNPDGEVGPLTAQALGLTL
jgi:catechol 2,3-dioxygenase-like lactoylglutathione lyase family enzyme